MNPACVEKNIAEIVKNGRVFKYSRLSGKSVSFQGIARTKYNKGFELLRICYVARFSIFWNVYVRVPWNILVQRKNQYL